MLRFSNVLVSLTILFILLTNLAYSNSVVNRTETLEIEHSEPPLSEFSAKFQDATFSVQEEQTIIAKVKVVNNKRDGYILTLHTRYGVLTPSGTTDGEVTIPYKLDYTQGNIFEQPGDNNGTFQTLLIPETPPTNPVRILGVASRITAEASLLSEPTEIMFNLRVGVPKRDEFIRMAGEYSDTITLTYEDF